MAYITFAVKRAEVGHGEGLVEETRRDRPVGIERLVLGIVGSSAKDVVDVATVVTAWKEDIRTRYYISSCQKC